jgi:peptidoglycan/LPS O-acetylase OafA/YrhL
MHSQDLQMTASNHIAPTRLGRMPTLDALRGIASVAVAWFHFTRQATSYAPDSLVILSGRKGWLGVQVFFVISGFVIPYAMFRSRYAVSDYGKFLLKRVTRLDPPYLVTIAIIILYAYLLTLRPSYVGEPYHFPATQVLLHLGYLNVVFGYEWLDGAFWSLAVEFQYYLLIALLFPAVLSKKARIRYLSIAVLVATSIVFRSSIFMFGYWGLFLLGIVTLQRHIKQIGTLTYLSLTVLIAASVVVSAGWPSAIVGLATSLVIAFVRLDSRVLAFFGRISYSLYLTHSPMGLPLLALIINRSHNAYLGLLIASIVTVALAYGFYLAIERPSQRLSSKLSYKRAAIAPVASVTQRPAQGVAV